MNVDSKPEVLVPFGVDRWSAQDVQVTAEAPFPCVFVRPDVPLRLHDGAGALSQRKPAAQDDPLASIRDQLKSLCDPWHRPAWDFVDTYLAAIEDVVARDASAILAQSVGGGGLYDARDWIYSAPCPLPRAHLHAPARGAGENAPTDELSVKVDFAFWNGRHFVAADFGRSRFLPRAAREREQCLLDAGAVLVEAMPQGEAGWGEFLGRLLPSPGSAFWSGETIPMGPFPSAALDVLGEMAVG
jgi:hypothetical protein